MGESIASISSRIAISGQILGAALLAICLLPQGAWTQNQNKDEQQRGAQGGSPGRSAPASASIFFCTTNNVECRTKINEFDLDEVRDLFVFAAWRNVQGEHMQQTRFLLPDGNLYQSVGTKFTAGTTTKSPGVQRAARSREDFAVNVALPVAGTHITQRSLAGTWTVEVYLDGKFITKTSLTFRPRATS